MKLSLHSDFKVSNLCFCVRNVTVSEGKSGRRRDGGQRRRRQARDGGKRAAEENEVDRCRDKVREGERRRQKRDRKAVKNNCVVCAMTKIFSEIYQSLLLLLQMS